jgi:hypothetical protein
MATLGGAPPLSEYRTLESDFLYGFDAVAVVPLGSQQPLPAMCQAQPKLSIVFVMRVRGEFSALLDLVVEKVGCFNHCDHHNKSPAHRGFNKAKTRQPGICSDGSREEADQPRRSRGIALRFTGDCRVENVQSRVGLPEARRLPSINHTSLWLGAWTPTLRTRTARSVACRCSSGGRLQGIIWVPSFQASTVIGAALCSTCRRTLRFWNSPRRRSRGVNSPASASVIFARQQSRQYG